MLLKPFVKKLRRNLNSQHIAFISQGCDRLKPPGAGHFDRNRERYLLRRCAVLVFQRGLRPPIPVLRHRPILFLKKTGMSWLFCQRQMEGTLKNFMIQVSNWILVSIKARVLLKTFFEGRSLLNIWNFLVCAWQRVNLQTTIKKFLKKSAFIFCWSIFLHLCFPSPARDRKIPNT